jgi:hypothetical protein
MTSVTELKDRSPRWLKDVANVATRGYGLATAPLRPVPDFLIIGTKRGGTTSLFNYLLMHPGVLGLFPQSRGKKSTDYFFKDLARGDQWYRSHFHTRVRRQRLADRLGYQPVGGEASPYYVWDPRIAPRVRALAPELRSIMLVRDPVERAWSHYQERRENLVEPLSFPDALAAEEDRTGGELERMQDDPHYYSEAHDWYSYRARGIYRPQIESWQSHFPREQLLILRSEDMYSDVQAVFSTVCRFLGIAEVELPTKKSFNASSAREAMPEEARAELTEFYAPHNRDLEAFLGRPLGWTS